MNFFLTICTDQIFQSIQYHEVCVLPVMPFCLNGVTLSCLLHKLLNSHTNSYLTILPLVPGEPRNVEVRKVNSSTLEVSWEPPADNNRNGVIRGYQIYVQPKNATVRFLIATHFFLQRNVVAITPCSYSFLAALSKLLSSHNDLQHS